MSGLMYVEHLALMLQQVYSIPMLLISSKEDKHVTSECLQQVGSYVPLYIDNTQIVITLEH